jgi:hypothetical protein
MKTNKYREIKYLSNAAKAQISVIAVASGGTPIEGLEWAAEMVANGDDWESVRQKGGKAAKVAVNNLTWLEKLQEPGKILGPWGKIDYGLSSLLYLTWYRSCWRFMPNWIGMKGKINHYAHKALSLLVRSLDGIGIIKITPSTLAKARGVIATP